VSSYFCTGGTTGAPKIAVRTHGNEIFDAWAAAQVFGEREEPRTYFCGLPLFHVNAQLATGLLPWMHGHHVLLATPEGYRGKNLMARFWEIAAHNRIATFSGVPTIYAALLEAPIDQASWHTTRKLKIPKNLTMVRLPPACPELIAAENIWQYLRQNYLSNRVFEDHSAILDACQNAWRRLLNEPGRIASIATREWAIIGQSL
jgi:acyl-CoA synthetase (AMP-forming)/AMP-acid ligase II